MKEFKRGMGELVKNLVQEELFIKDLKPDAEAGKIFFTGREKCGAFYFKGRSLFTYKKDGFSTHHKFGFIPDGLNRDYIFENQLQGLLPVRKFHLGYEDIKKRAEQYADREADGVSALYKYAPTADSFNDRYFLVDIEIVFHSADDTTNNEDDRKRDRIDIVLYDNQKRQLLFCEAKHFSNPEIWGDTPVVVKQLNRYNKQIATRKKNIISQYTTAFKEYNAVMDSALNAPESVCDTCGLYIFGFSNPQKRELEKRMKGGAFYGHKCRIIGNTKNDSAERIYKALA